MTIQITTHGDALRHTARRVIVAVFLTVVLTVALIFAQFGVDMEATVRVGLMMTSGIITGIIISALLAGGLTYRSALVMRELTLTRAKLCASRAPIN
jgi:hypothetical protein